MSKRLENHHKHILPTYNWTIRFDRALRYQVLLILKVFKSKTKRKSRSYQNC